MNKLLAVVFGLTGLLFAATADATNGIGLRMALAALLILTVSGIAVIRTSGQSFLSRFMVVVYAVPFSGLIGYVLLYDLFFEAAEDARFLSLDEGVVSLLAVIGCVGLCGLLAGMCIGAGKNAGKVKQLGDVNKCGDCTIGRNSFIAISATVVCFALMNAGPTSLLSGNYFEDALDAATAGGAFSALTLVAYALVVLLVVDTSFELDQAIGRIKRKLCITSLGTIVLFAQLLKGDRDSAGLIVGCAVLYVLTGWDGRADRSPSAMMSRARRASGPMAVVVLLFLAVGQLRFQSNNAETVVSAAVEEVAGGGTWTSVLLGSFGAAYELRNGTLEHRNGKTYIDYVVSLPPRFLTDVLGVKRPIEAESSPGLWYYPLQIGGVHPTLVPLANFGVSGVFWVLLAMGALIARVDRASDKAGYSGLIVFGSFFAFSFSWFWYGDMVFLRGMMATAIAIGVSIALRRTADVREAS